MPMPIPRTAVRMNLTGRAMLGRQPTMARARIPGLMMKILSQQ